ncbi:MAG: ribonuclease HI family protein [Patescibacteria group bacterium]|nr:ribonuclease HI family protein [Patescibacteria group bacterium]
MTTLKIYTDGGSKGNPGPATIGVVFFIKSKKILQHHQPIGVATNNDAEYQALIFALEKLKEIKNQYAIDKIIFHSDSQLLINQVNGFYKIKNGKIKEYILKIKILEQEINLPIVYKQIPREKNKEADKMVNQIF